MLCIVVKDLFGLALYLLLALFCLPFFFFVRLFCIVFLLFKIWNKTNPLVIKIHRVPCIYYLDIL